jgi:hypothetical protein
LKAVFTGDDSDLNRELARQEGGGGLEVEEEENDNQMIKDAMADYNNNNNNNNDNLVDEDPEAFVAQALEMNAARQPN